MIFAAFYRFHNTTYLLNRFDLKALPFVDYKGEGPNVMGEGVTFIPLAKEWDEPFKMAFLEAAHEKLQQAFGCGFSTAVAASSDCLSECRANNFFMVSKKIDPLIETFFVGASGLPINADQKGSAYDFHDFLIARKDVAPLTRDKAREFGERLVPVLEESFIEAEKKLAELSNKSDTPGLSKNNKLRLGAPDF